MRLIGPLTKGTHLHIVGEIQTSEYVAKGGTKKSATRAHRIGPGGRRALIADAVKPEGSFGKIGGALAHPTIREDPLSITARNSPNKGRNTTPLLRPLEPQDYFSRRHLGQEHLVALASFWTLRPGPDGTARERSHAEISY